MKIKCLFLAICGLGYLLNTSSLNAQSMSVRQLNFTTFPAPQQDHSADAELLAMVPHNYQNHPEFGILPFDIGSDSVMELIQKRTQFSRTLVKRGTHGGIVYSQQGYDPLSYMDSSGWWRTIDQSLHPSQQTSGLYEAANQICPTYINTVSKNAGIINGINEIKFNSNLQLYYEDASGNRTLLGSANWSNYTAGSDGVKVYGIWPGIDMEIIVSNGKMKTNYYINAPINYPNGWLVIEDHPLIPAGLTADFTSTIVDQDGLNFSKIDVKDANNTSAFTLSSAYGYDQSGNRALTVPFGCKLGTGNAWQIYIPAAWAGNTALQFPLVIDPLVSSSNTVLQAAITGSGLNNSGTPVGSCPYSMSVNTPANCTCTDVFWKFDYIAQNGAVLCDGQLEFFRGACRSPGAGLWWFCNNCIFAGTCNSGALPGISMWTDVSTCMPAPSCAPVPVAFTMKFYDDYGGAACSNFFIGANSNWVMTIQGQTVAQTPVPSSSNGTTICLGTTTTLTATPSWGVPGYTYLWSPGGATTQSYTVAPTVTTTYTCVVTDVCGNTASNQVTITVNSVNTLAPAPVITSSMSPASGSPCPVTITFCGNVGNNYGGGSENFQWSFGGGTVTSGGVTSGSAAGPIYGGAGSSAFCGASAFYTVVYSSPGSYYPSITITKLGACAVTTNTITICGALPVELLTFTAHYDNDGKVLLQWSTATETNNNYFIVERTIDGSHFEEVGRVFTHATAGNSISQLDYSLTDENPELNGTTYYRLKQFDVNGQEQSFPMTSVTINEETPGLSIHPNPGNEIVNITFDSPLTLTSYIRIFDNTGRLVKEIPVEAGTSVNQSVPVDMSEFNEGFYFVQVSSGDKIYNGKLLKK